MGWAYFQAKAGVHLPGIVYSQSLQGTYNKSFQNLWFFSFFFFFELQNEEETKKEESLKSPLKLESQLDLRVQELIKLICNVQAMEEMMVEMKYDTKKAPLGRTSDSILHAHFIFLVHLTGYFITIMI